MKKILGCVRAAIDDYKMIVPGDRIAVGVSGGKDSLLLLKALCELQRFYPKPFELTAITLDMRFGGADGDYSEIQTFCDFYSVPYIIKRTELARLIFDVRQENNPCSLCARMRRGALHNAALENGCNKIALGHHLDDAAETLMMNLLNEGRIDCFSPVTYLSRKNITMIRPLLYLRESEIESAATRLKLPVIKSKCPANGNTAREDAKDLLLTLDQHYGEVYKKIESALKKSGTDGW